MKEINIPLRIKGTTLDGRIFDDQHEDHCPACGHKVRITLEANLNDEQVQDLEQNKDVEVVAGVIKIYCPQCELIDYSLKTKRVTIHKKQQ